MRIIAGTLRGRRISAPEGLETRPMLDRQRQALFDILQASFPCEGVLDLFAGSGALAIESLSRGAARATLVDSSPAARRTIAQNLETLGLGERAQVLAGDALRLGFAGLGHAVDLVFCDPPFPLYEAGPERILALLARVAAEASLGQDARLVLRVRDGDPVPEPPPPLVKDDERRYGDSRIILLSRPAACDEERGRG